MVQKEVFQTLKKKNRKLSSVAFRAINSACDHVIWALFPKCYTSTYRRLDIEALLSVASKSIWVGLLKHVTYMLDFCACADSFK